MLQKKQTTAATANPCSAMESGNHLKNGVCLKNLMSRRNLLTIVSFLLFAIFVNACKDKDKVDEIPLSAPTSVTATQVEEGIKVSWKPAGGADYYEIYITSNDIKVDGYKVYDCVTVFKPKTSGNYSFRVRAMRGYESSDWSVTVSCNYTDPNALTTPTGLTATQVKDSIYVSWDSVRVADRYLLRAFDNKGWSNDYSYKTPGMTFFNMTHGTKYSFQVKAYRGTESSDWSDTVSCVYVDPDFLEMPTGLKAIQVKDSIKVSWDSVKGADSYILSASNNKGWSNNSYSCKTPDALFFNLTDGAKYTFQVRARRGEVVSAWSNAVSCVYTDSTVLTVPTGLTAIQVKDSIKISWNSVEGADRYLMSASNDQGWSRSYTCTTPDTLLYNLTDGAKYMFQVKACRKNKSTAWSEAVSCVYIDSTVLVVPTGLTVKQVKNTIEVSWDAVEGADSYTVSVSGNNGWNKEFSYTTPKMEFSNPTNGVKYTFKVKAHRRKKFTDWSGEAFCVYFTPGGGSQSGLYMGIIGFNEILTGKNISLLTDYKNTDNTYSFTSFVNSMTMKDNTGLYYGVDNAINLLENATLPNDLAKVSIITFTDGLDNFSIELDTKYETRNAFRDAVNKRIHNTSIKGKEINAFSIGVRGDDIKGEGAIREFKAGLDAMEDRGQVYELTDMNEVNNAFSELAKLLYKESANMVVKLKIPGGYDDSTKIRFTFDNVTDAVESEVYIEGIYRRDGPTRTLQNVVYHGVKSSNGTTIVGEYLSGNVYFSFADFDGVTVAEVKNTKQWYSPSTEIEWIKNKEFGKDGDIEPEVERNSAVIVLVLDCTSSLGDNGFRQMKTAATNFIKILTNK